MDNVELMKFKPIPECCVGENEEWIYCNKECGPTCSYFQNENLPIAPCSCGRELIIVLDMMDVDTVRKKIIKLKLKL